MSRTTRHRFVDCVGGDIPNQNNTNVMPRERADIVANNNTVAERGGNNRNIMVTRTEKADSEVERKNYDSWS